MVRLAGLSRFEWKVPSHQWTILPMDGVLQPRGNSQAVVTFRADEATSFEDQSLRLLTQDAEPSCENETPTEKILIVLSHQSGRRCDVLSVVQAKGRCGRVQAQCSVEAIVFDATVLFERGVSHFRLRNEGCVGFDYKWTMDDASVQQKTFRIISASSGYLQPSADVQVEHRRLFIGI